MPRTTARLPGSVGVGLELVWWVSLGWVERESKGGREGKGGIDGGVGSEVSGISPMPLHIAQEDRNQIQKREGKSAKKERNPPIRRKDEKPQKIEGQKSENEKIK